MWPEEEPEAGTCILIGPGNYSDSHILMGSFCSLSLRVRLSTPKQSYSGKLKSGVKLTLEKFRRSLICCYLPRSSAAVNNIRPDRLFYTQPHSIIVECSEGKVKHLKIVPTFLNFFGYRTYIKNRTFLDPCPFSFVYKNMFE